MRRGRERRAFPLLLLNVLLGGLLACPAAVHAQGQRIVEQLRVEPGVTCLNAEQLAVQVERWLDGAPVAKDLTIVVDGSMFDPRQVRLNIIRDRKTVAHRAFEPGPEPCDHLHDAVALAIAMVLKALRVEEPPSPEPAPQPEPEAPAVRMPRWSIAGVVLASYRLLPELAPGLELRARYDFNEHFALRLGVLGALSFGVPLAQNAGSFDATLAAARADACGRRRLAGGVHGGFCFGLLGGALGASGTDVSSPQSSTVPAFALAGAAELAFELSERWSIELGLSMTLLLHGVRVGVAGSSGMPGSSRALDSPGFALGVGPAYHFD